MLQHVCRPQDPQTMITVMNAYLGLLFCHQVPPSFLPSILLLSPSFILPPVLPPPFPSPSSLPHPSPPLLLSPSGCHGRLHLQRPLSGLHGVGGGAPAAAHPLAPPSDPPAPPAGCSGQRPHEDGSRGDHREWA